MKFKRRASEVRHLLPAIFVALTALFSGAAVIFNYLIGGNGFGLSLVIIIFAAFGFHATVIMEYFSSYELKEDHLVEKLGFMKVKIPYSDLKINAVDEHQYVYYTTNGNEPKKYKSKMFFPKQYDDFKTALIEKLSVQ